MATPKAAKGFSVSFDGEEAPVEETRYDREILEDIRSFMKEEETLQAGRDAHVISHVLQGTWQLDGGPGVASNPQLQMMTDRLTSIRL